LYRQYYQYGYWKVFVNKKHQTITTVRQLIPMLFVLYLILLTASAFVCKALFLGMSTFGLLYLLLAFVFAVRSAFSFGGVLGVAFTFFILHFSYGLGYLKGIFDFFILGKAIKKQESLSR
jgi:hypothetical protein